MTIPCKHARECGVPWSVSCAINAFGKDKLVPFGTCLTLCHQYDGPDRKALSTQFNAEPAVATRSVQLGAVLRRVIHFMLDCVDAFVRPRARDKLWIVDVVKTCAGCKEREILIDRYTLYQLDQLWRWFGKEAT